MLHKLERATNRKSCDRDAGGCGRKSTLQVFLQGAQPRCFALQLVWESGQESGLDIRETLDIIQEVRSARHSQVPRMLLETYLQPSPVTMVDVLLCVFCSIACMPCHWFMIERFLSCRGVLADSISHLSAKPDRLALRILLGSADHHPVSRV